MSQIWPDDGEHQDSCRILVSKLTKESYSAQAHNDISAIIRRDPRPIRPGRATETGVCAHRDRGLSRLGKSSANLETNIVSDDTCLPCRSLRCSSYMWQSNRIYRKAQPWRLPMQWRDGFGSRKRGCSYAKPLYSRLLDYIHSDRSPPLGVTNARARMSSPRRTCRRPDSQLKPVTSPGTEWPAPDTPILSVQATTLQSRTIITCLPLRHGKSKITNMRIER